MNICSVIVKKYKPQSSKKVIEEKENILKQDFSTTTINEKRVGDMTYIHTLRDGWCYLVSVLDLHSKKIIGYCFSKRMTTELVIKALNNAYDNQNPQRKVIFHTDLESQYTSNEMKELTKKLKILQSFSTKGFMDQLVILHQKIVKELLEKQRKSFIFLSTILT